MAPFVLMVVGGYVGMQLFVYWRLRGVLPARGPWRGLLMAWLIGTGLAFFAHRALEARGWHHAACVAGLVSHWWVVASTWFMGFSLLAGVWNLAVRAASRWRPGAARLRLAPRALVAGIAVAVLLLSAWGFIEPWAVRLETLEVRAAQLPPGSNPIRVVQVSDLHLNTLMSRKRLARILARIRQARPDLLVFTGDFADQACPHVDALAAMLEPMDAPLGKFAVTGNHELYRGLSRSTPLIRAAGFTLLHGQSVRVAPGLVVSGVDDIAATRAGVNVAAHEDDALPPRERRDFVILLKHRPHVAETSLGRFDIQLSGHTHGGQVFPGRWLLRLFCRRLVGHYDLGHGSSLYVSRGAGTFGVPMRLLSRPEVTLILIQASKP